MRYMNLEGHTHKVNRYRHNNKGFCENFTFLKFIIELPMQA